MMLNVVLERRAEESLGIAIKRGTPDERAANGALVVNILPSGPAFGKLWPGDVIMSVNGVSLEDKSHEEILDLLRRADGWINLLVYRHEEMEVIERARKGPAFNNSTSCQSLFGPEDVSEFPRHGTPGFATSLSFPPHAVSLPQLATYSDDYRQPPRLTSLFKVNLAKQNVQGGLGVELSGQLVITSVVPGSKAEKAGIRVGDRVVNLNGIDAAHLSLIDAAHLMRRDQSDVTVMRVEGDGVEVMAMPTRVIAGGPGEAVEYFTGKTMGSGERHSCCTLQDPLQVMTSPAEYSPVLFKPNHSPSHEDRVPCCMTHACSCQVSPRSCIVHSEASSPAFFKITEDLDNEGSETMGQKEEILRTVEIRSNPVCGTGIRIAGGNMVGIFVSEVNEQSPAAQAGVKCGDEIISINGKPVKSMTKSEAAQRILKSARTLHLETKSSVGKYEAFRNGKLGPGDNFHVRAAFTFCPSVLGGDGDPCFDPPMPLPPLQISRGDIFHVTDSLLGGSFSSWLARRVLPNVSGVGIIPSIGKAIQILKSQFPPLQRNPGVVPKPYQRVIQLAYYPYPRPVIIYGPLADKAMQLLVEDVSTLDDGNGEPRFEVPPVSGAPPHPDDNSWTAQLSPPSPNVIRLSAIQMLMERGKHPVLNLRPAAIESLIMNGITPIVLLVTARSEMEVRAAVDAYRVRPRCAIGDSVGATRKLWSELAALRHDLAHLLTDSVPLNDSAQDRFDESTWLQNIIALIRHHQSQPVWVTEDSAAYCKAQENAFSPFKSPRAPLVSSIEDSSSVQSEPDASFERQIGCNESSDDWNNSKRLELMEDGITTASVMNKAKSEIRRVRIQSPSRPDSRSTQTESPCRLEGVGSLRESEKAEGRRGRRHRALSPRNAPLGLLSEPQLVVAEVSGEFLPNEGGKLELPEQGVELLIPPGAIPDDGEGGMQEIYLRVYGSDHLPERFDGNQPHVVSPLVMCGPRGLRFQKPVTLTMPRFHKHWTGSAVSRGQEPIKTSKEAQTSDSASWSLRVMHAATISDAATSASDSENKQHALRQWRNARPPLSALIGKEEASEEKVVSKIRSPSGTESDSSGTAITYQIADASISLLINHF